jgi:hypothetical protein
MLACNLRGKNVLHKNLSEFSFKSDSKSLHFTGIKQVTNGIESGKEANKSRKIIKNCNETIKPILLQVCNVSVYMSVSVFMPMSCKLRT